MEVLLYTLHTVLDTKHLPESHWVYHVLNVLNPSFFNVVNVQSVSLKFAHSVSNHLVFGLAGEHQSNQDLISVDLRGQHDKYVQ